MKKHVLRVTGRPEIMKALDVSSSNRPAPPLPFSIETGQLRVEAPDSLDEIRSGLGGDYFAHLVRLNSYADALVFADPREDTLWLAGGAFLARTAMDASKMVADPFAASAKVAMPPDFEALDASVERMLRDLVPLAERERGERAFVTLRDEEIDETTFATPLRYGYTNETIEDVLQDLVRVGMNASGNVGTLCLAGEPPYHRGALPLDLAITVARFLDTVASQGVTARMWLPAVARVNRSTEQYEAGRIWCMRRPVRFDLAVEDQTALERAQAHRRLADLAQRFEMLEPALARAITTLLATRG